MALSISLSTLLIAWIVEVPFVNRNCISGIFDSVAFVNILASNSEILNTFLSVMRVYESITGLSFVFIQGFCRECSPASRDVFNVYALCP
jgi:hypothetical protein